MTAATTTSTKKMVRKTGAGTQKKPYDVMLLGTVAVLLCLGLVMVYSSSISIADRQLGEPGYYFVRQFIYVMFGVIAAALVFAVPLKTWQQSGPVLLMVGISLLLLVLMPGIGREVNGSTRWMSLGIINLQVSELVKLFVVVYMAGYLVRRGDEVRTSVGGFLKPMTMLVVISVLLLCEPDFGATAVIVTTALAMMFVAGVRLWQFMILMLVVLAALSVLAVTSPYRMQRLTAFLDPWADPFNSGFQLTQALIAFGRGEWLGVGLGGSVQKLFYLPEAHTDFVFAVLAEELGLLGAVSVIVMFAIVVWRAFVMARLAEQCGKFFEAYLAYGLGVWIGLQAYINIGVNMGVLPTKGLTLPLMSYGGSSIMVMCVAIALLLRIDHEVRYLSGSKRSKTSKGVWRR